MGYRSEVCAVFYCPKEDYPVMKLFMDENEPKDNQLFDKSNEDYYEVCDLSDKMMVKFLFPDVKWYETYPEVIAFMEFIETFGKIANSKSSTWNYEFIRLGEEYEDIDARESDDSDNLIQVRREIEFNF
jgi:hypothetical protein